MCIEHESINRGTTLNKTIRLDYIKAWEEGKRGAHGRCCHALFGGNRLSQLSYASRSGLFLCSPVVATLANLLAGFLARQFLDFEREFTSRNCKYRPEKPVSIPYGFTIPLKTDKSTIPMGTLPKMASRTH